MIWHDLRTKPRQFEYLLVETKTKHYPYRVCIFCKRDEFYYFHDAYKTSYFYTRKSWRAKNLKDDFVVKRWAYIDDLLNLDKK